MKIKVKIGDVEIGYEKETEPDSANAATCADDWSKAASQEKLLSTVRELADVAKQLHDGMYA